MQGYQSLAAIWIGFACLPALRADVALYDSGAGVSGSGTAVGWYQPSSTMTQYSKAQSFTNSLGQATITAISVWVAQGSATLSGSFNLSLFNATGTVGSTATPVVGSPIYTASYNTSALGTLTGTAQQATFSGLNWSIGNGNYFFAFDATPMPDSSPSANYFTLRYSVPEVAGQNMAYSTDSLSSWTAYQVGSSHPTLAATVYASVPEPGTLPLAGLLLVLVAIVFFGWAISKQKALDPAGVAIGDPGSVRGFQGVSKSPMSALIKD